VDHLPQYDFVGIPSTSSSPTKAAFHPRPVFYNDGEYSDSNSTKSIYPMHVLQMLLYVTWIILIDALLVYPNSRKISSCRKLHDTVEDDWRAPEGSRRFAQVVTVPDTVIGQLYPINWLRMRPHIRHREIFVGGEVDYPVITGGREDKIMTRSTLGEWL
jgi:hypothetical protein